MDIYMDIYTHLKIEPPVLPKRCLFFLGRNVDLNSNISPYCVSAGHQCKHFTMVNLMFSITIIVTNL